MTAGVPDGTRLGRDVAELERTDPLIGAAARALDYAIWRANRPVPITRFRKSTPDRPCEVLR